MDGLATIAVSILLLWAPRSCEGHGRMREPPSRASMWRDGFNTPKNYNDNKLFCGGFDVNTFQLDNMNALNLQEGY